MLVGLWSGGFLQAAAVVDQGGLVFRAHVDELHAEAFAGHHGADGGSGAQEAVRKLYGDDPIIFRRTSVQDGEKDPSLTDLADFAFHVTISGAEEGYQSILRGVAGKPSSIFESQLRCGRHRNRPKFA